MQAAEAAGHAGEGRKGGKGFSRSDWAASVSGLGSNAPPAFAAHTTPPPPKVLMCAHKRDRVGKPALALPPEGIGVRAPACFRCHPEPPPPKVLVCAHQRDPVGKRSFQPPRTLEKHAFEVSGLDNAEGIAALRKSFDAFLVRGGDTGGGGREGCPERRVGGWMGVRDMWSLVAGRGRGAGL